MHVCYSFFLLLAVCGSWWKILADIFFDMPLTKV